MKFPPINTEHQNTWPVLISLVLFSFAMIIFGLVVNPLDQIVAGLMRIMTEPDSLITDYIELACMGAAFVNAGLILLISIMLLRVCRMPFTGISIACCFQMAGFALFGKNLINTLPILLGVLLYSRFTRESMDKYIYIALFGTALSPVITEMGIMFSENSMLPILIGLITGVAVGFVLVPVTANTARTHMGYNLYNMGFSAGLICLMLVALLRSFGMQFTLNTVWSSGNNLILSIFLFLCFAAFIVGGFFLNNKSFKGYLKIMRHSGRAIADFVLLDGVPVTLINIGVMGSLATVYVLMVGGALNGPTIGAIFSVAGFSAFGKHPKNALWPVLGVMMASSVMLYALDDPAVLLVALFATGLAPIAGQFGPVCGLVAGAFHVALAMDIGGIVGGLNLYNNGFAIGLSCLVLVPLFEAYTTKRTLD